MTIHLTAYDEAKGKFSWEQTSEKGLFWSCTHFRYYTDERLRQFLSAGATIVYNLFFPSQLSIHS